MKPYRNVAQKSVEYLVAGSALASWTQARVIYVLQPYELFPPLNITQLHVVGNFPEVGAHLFPFQYKSAIVKYVALLRGTRKEHLMHSAVKLVDQVA
jgi:hypothetical protein